MFDSVCSIPPKVTRPLGTSLASMGHVFKLALVDYLYFFQEVSDSIHQALVVSRLVFK